MSHYCSRSGVWRQFMSSRNAERAHGERLLLSAATMRILLASIRADRASTVDAPFVVAYIYCQRDRATVAPVHSALEETNTIVWLRHLVAALGGTDPYANLLALDSYAWSFDAADGHSPR